MPGAKPVSPADSLRAAAEAEAAGRPAAAAAAYRAFLARVPDHVPALTNLGHACLVLGRWTEAAAVLERATRLAPGHPLPWVNRAMAELALGRPAPALASARRAIALGAEGAGVWRTYVRAIEAAASVPWTPQLPDELAHCLIDPDLASAPVRSVAVRLLLGHARGAATTAPPLSHPMVLALLGTDKLGDADLETLLSAWRRALLAHADGGRPLPPALEDGGLAFRAALALQCGHGDYALFEGDDERAAVDRLVARLAGAIEAGWPPDAAVLAVVAAYRPLHRLPFADALPIGDLPPALARLVAVQWADPRRERALEPAIPVLGPLTDAVSAAVRAQYEEHPYPRWRTLPTVRPTTPADFVAACLPLADRADLPAPPDDAAVLVAGCGTGRAAVAAARRFPRATVTAVDLSRASLAYARRQADALGTPSIAFAQADLVGLGAWEARFDLVDCCGVLHHLRDPAAGLAVLVRLLAPGGVLHLSLYSETARAPLAAARALCAERGCPPTPAGIRGCRRHILALPPGHPARAVTDWSDFYTLSHCRDLLFHVQEHRFTPDRLRRLLDGAGLRFLGFEGVAGAVIDAYQTRFPGDPTAIDLAGWAAFEPTHPETFKTMYSFWAAPTIGGAGACPRPRRPGNGRPPPA